MDPSEVDRRAIDEAHALVVSGDWARAVPILEELHARGVPEGTGMLGLLYSSGQGVPMNGPLAEQMLLTAASAGVGTAAHNLGTLYLGGVPGVARDRNKALHYYRLARSLGCQPAPDSFYEDPKD